MNYYEEFGIPRDAPAAKIRQAYKTLARVLHPDAHPDEALKAMAERQMRRLNAMQETLLDPEKRRAYDASLFDAGHRRSMPSAEMGWGGVDTRRYLLLCWRLQVMRERAVLAAVARHAGLWASLMRAARRHWAWILTGLMMAGAGVWYVAARDSAVVEVAPAETATPAESSRANSGGARTETWAGSWTYVSRPDADRNAPSSAELRLVEEHGNLTGNYRARYRTPDQALPADIAFRAEGKAPSGNSAILVWTSDDGAQGEVELTLRTYDLMKVTWRTTASGAGAALTAGTATLVRQRAR